MWALCWCSSAAPQPLLCSSSTSLGTYLLTQGAEVPEVFPYHLSSLEEFYGKAELPVSSRSLQAPHPPQSLGTQLHNAVEPI